MKSATQDNQAQQQETDRHWQAVADRDRSWDGRFVYAVQSTGVYCRPSCPSRRPHRRQVVFFAVPEAAEREGYRPCLRCRPQQVNSSDRETQAVRVLCRQIAERTSHHVDIAAIADQAQITSRRLRSLFKQLLEVTPTQYAQACRRQQVKALLQNGHKVTRALYEADYGSVSRLYENVSGKTGMTPATCQRGGKGVTIRYTVTDSPPGNLLVAAAIGQPTAVRAVARACASNPVALIVPCHRVIGRISQLTGYRWGLKRKQDLLVHEQQAHNPQAQE